MYCSYKLGKEGMAVEITNDMSVKWYHLVSGVFVMDREEELKIQEKHWLHSLMWHEATSGYAVFLGSLSAYFLESVRQVTIKQESFM